MKPIYLDYNATTPVDPRVAEAMQPYLTQYFGNPSSGHSFGIETRKAVDQARKQIADLLGCFTDEIIFTSGGSEANNYAIKGGAFKNHHKGNHIITTTIEHPAVTEVCAYLETQGFNITYLPVDKHGLIDPGQVADAITPQTILVSVMLANNEVGTIEPISEIAQITRSNDILFHSDCAQAVGKIPVKVAELGIDMLSMAGHKLYAPKGIGVLYKKRAVQLEKLIHGADHEMNRRAGTENVLEIVGLGIACELVADLDQTMAHTRKMRDRLEKGLLDSFPEARVNGHPELRLPNTCSISFPNQEANTILAELDTVAASAGASCHADQVDVSTVLEAMQVPLEYAMGTIRLSVGRFTTVDEIDRAIDEISAVVRRLHPTEPVTVHIPDGEEIRLTKYTHGLGCACKLRPQLLEKVLQKMPVPNDPAILVGTDTSDDAAVYKINDDTAIIQTVDFFTPIVDDPYQFGEIAAANSLSDIYAMGGKALFALNIVGFPSNRLPMQVLKTILQGANDKAAEAGVAIIGGHTVDDTEPKFGLAVTGITHPEKIITNRGARVGDVLILTKPIGTGILSTALKRQLLSPEETELLTTTMATLNKAAAEAIQDVGVNACTDVTGFGLLGHLLEMMNGSHTTAVVQDNKVPLLPRAAELIGAGVVPGGTRDNYAFTAPSVSYGENVTEVQQLLLNDAQTSGGLLIAVDPKRAPELLQRLNDTGMSGAEIIGEVTARGEKAIVVH